MPVATESWAQPTIFETAFLNGGSQLLAGDSAGQVHVWGITELLRAEYWESAAPGHKPLPAYTHKLHDCSIFSVALWKNKVVITGSDDSIKAWDVASLTTHGSKPKLLGTAVPPQLKLGRGSVSEVPETNGLAINRAGTCFFSANGDGKAYSWDVETMKCTGSFEGHTDYLLCVASQGDNGLVTGSEDGTARLWDVRSGKGEQLPMPSGAAKGWVGAVDAESGDNWVVAGGGGKCMWLWHLASRRVVAAMPTCGAVQAAKFCGDNIVSAGAESALYRWRCNGKLHSRVPTTSSSVFSVSHAQIPGHNSESIVTAGTGGDVSFYFQGGGELGFKLAIQ